MGHLHHHHHQHQHQHHRHESDNLYDDPLFSCCCCPCFLVSHLFRGIGRCMFVACYPIIQCFGLDEKRHQHHHRHFD